MQQRIAWLLTIRIPDEDRQQRGRILLLILLSLIAMCFLDLPLTLSLPSPSGLIATLGSLLIFVGLFLLTRHGHVTLAAVTLIASNFLAIFGSALGNGALSTSVFLLAVPLLVASLTLRPWQIWPVLLVALLGVASLIPFLPTSPFADMSSRTVFFGGLVFLLLISVISFLGASSIAGTLRAVRQARTQLEASAAELEQRVSERTGALETALTEVYQRRCRIDPDRRTELTRP